MAMQSLRELGNSRFLCLKAIPYGFRPFLVDGDRKELIAVIERIEPRIRIARDAIVRRRRIRGCRRFLDALGLRQFLGERQRFPQQAFNPLTRLSGILRHPCDMPGFAEKSKRYPLSAGVSAALPIH